jgi:hypothetical protein
MSATETARLKQARNGAHSLNRLVSWRYYRVKPHSKWVTNCGQAWVVKKDWDYDCYLHVRGRGWHVRCTPKYARQIVESTLIAPNYNSGYCNECGMLRSQCDCWDSVNQL